MSTDREQLTELKEAFWKEPEEVKEEVKPINEKVDEDFPADPAPESAPAEEVKVEPKVGDGEAGDGGGEG